VNARAGVSLMVARWKAGPKLLSMKSDGKGGTSRSERGGWEVRLGEEKERGEGE
jgi:hypothetical protein